MLCLSGECPGHGFWWVLVSNCCAWQERMNLDAWRSLWLLILTSTKLGQCSCFLFPFNFFFILMPAFQGMVSVVAFLNSPRMKTKLSFCLWGFCSIQEVAHCLPFVLCGLCELAIYGCFALCLFPFCLSFTHEAIAVSPFWIHRRSQKFNPAQWKGFRLI